MERQTRMLEEKYRSFGYGNSGDRTTTITSEAFTTLLMMTITSNLHHCQDPAESVVPFSQLKCHVFQCGSE